MKTIIVATNYSASSNNAIKYAAALARLSDAKLVLFNSFEISIHAANTLLPASSIEELIMENDLLLKDIASKTSRTFCIPVKAVTGDLFLKEELDKQVKCLKADLVVMGMSESYTEHGYENTTTFIIRHATYPVLAIRENVSFEGISKILFAYDADCMHAANKLPLLMEVAAFFKAAVQVYHVGKTAYALADQDQYTGSTDTVVEKLLNKVDHSYKDIAEDDVIKGIEAGINEFKADLLVMVPHKYGFWESMWHKGKTSKMSRRIHIPLLALPNPDHG